MVIFVMASKTAFRFAKYGSLKTNNCLMPPILL